MTIRTLLFSSAMLAMAGLLSACGTQPGERALTGGALGAGTGAGLTAAAGGNPVTGALAGGLAGSILGAATTPASGGGSAHASWCAQRYSSYDYSTDSYLGYDGYRHRCVSPYY